MNPSIAGIVDQLFQDIEMNEETIAFHEELMNNCQEHYNDLLSRGYTEAEALDAVLESLRGMKDVLDEYPKKSAPAKDAEQAAPAAGAQDAPREKSEPMPPQPDDFRFSPSQVSSLRAELAGQNVTLAPSQDEWIHVRCEKPGQILCDLAGSMLRITKNPVTPQNAPSAGDSEGFSLEGVINLVSRAISSFTSLIIDNAEPVRIEVPETLLERVELDTRSGDITVTQVPARQLSLHTASGDIRLTLESEQPVTNLSAGSASGDLFICSPALDAELTTISGDIILQSHLECVRLKSTSGDIRLDGSAAKAVISTVSGDVHLHGSAVQAEVSSVSGDVSLTLLEDKAESLSLRSTSGDVEVYLPRILRGVHAECSSRSGSCRCDFEDAGPDARTRIIASSLSGDVTIS